jgi:alpha-ribazole phosphatase
MSDVKTTTIDLIRHGEPEGGKKFRGQLDDPLSEKGWKQMWSAVNNKCPWDVIVSSPLRRCVDFASELAQKHNLPLEVDDRLREIRFGEWEGQTPKELTDVDPEILIRFWSDPIQNRPPGAEPLAAFRKRIASALNDVTAKHEGRHVLIVGHAGVIRMTMLNILDVPLDGIFRINVPNAGITRIRFDQYERNVIPRLIFHAGTL